jgi:hypothetical protein
MQCFDAAEQDCNSALRIDKRMTKALFRYYLIAWYSAPCVVHVVKSSHSQAWQSTYCPQQSNRSHRGFQESTALNLPPPPHMFRPFSCLFDSFDSFQVLSLDPGNHLAQAELAQLDGSAAKVRSSTAASLNAFSSSSAKITTVGDAPPKLSVHHPAPSSSSASFRKEPPSKVTAFKPGFLNPEPVPPKPRRIQIKEDSDESEPDAPIDHAPEAVFTQSSVSAVALNFVPPLKHCHSAVTAAAPAAVAVTDEDIVARAARIASLNVCQSSATF